MIGVLTHHWALEGHVDDAKAILDRNGRAQSRAPGFVLRYSLASNTDPNKLSSLVVWQSEKIYDLWKASPERAAAMAGAELLWIRPPESERFEVTDEIIASSR